MVPDLVIVIVAYNSSRVIGALLDSIPAAVEGLSYEVVVVDNGLNGWNPGGCHHTGRMQCGAFCKYWIRWRDKPWSSCRNVRRGDTYPES